MPVGTLCAIDTKPRNLTRDQLAGLRDLASMVESEMKTSNLSKDQKFIKNIDCKSRLELIDPITRLWNQRGMRKILDREWEDGTNCDSRLTIIMASIDHFKKITSTYGDAAGDAVMKAVAKKLLEILKGEDTVGRVGNQDFMILLRSPAAESEAAIAEAIDHLNQKIIINPMIIGFTKHAVTLSLGTASATRGEGTVDGLVTKAEEELYRVKKSKRGASEFAA